MQAGVALAPQLAAGAAAQVPHQPLPNGSGVADALSDLEPAHRAAIEAVVLIADALQRPGARAAAHAQLATLASHMRALKAIIAEQTSLTGVHPLSAEAEQQEEDDEELGVPSMDPTLAGDASGGVDSMGVPLKQLAKEQEQGLGQVFGFTDTPNDLQTTALAYRFRISEEQVRSHFSRLRAAVRSALTKIAHKRAPPAAHRSGGVAPRAGTAFPPPPTQAPAAGGHSGGSYGAGGYGGGGYGGSYGGAYGAGAPVTAQQEQQQQQQEQQEQQGIIADEPDVSDAGCGSGVPPLTGKLSELVRKAAADRDKLRACLDGAGGIALLRTGQMLVSMANCSSWPVRGEHADAISSSNGSVLQRLVGSRVLEVLEGWLKAAEQAQQVSVLKQVLKALLHLPVNTLLLQLSGTLQRTVESLHEHPSPGVRAASLQLSQHWRRLDSMTLEVAEPLLLGKGAVGAGAAPHQRQLAAAVRRRVQELGIGGAGVAPMAVQRAVPQGGALPGSRPLSTDDIRKAKEREKLLAGGATSNPTGPSDGFKRPSKLARTASGGAQAPQLSENARRLLQLHAQSSQGPRSPTAAANQQQQQQQRQEPTLLSTCSITQQQLAMYGPAHQEVHSAIAQYNSQVVRWASWRPGRIREEGIQARDAAERLRAEGLGVGGTGWREVPLVAEAPKFAKGEKSQISKEAHHMLERATTTAPADSPAEPRTLLPPQQPPPTATIPWVPVNPDEDNKQHDKLWSVGIRMPVHVPRLPSQQVLAEAQRAQYMAQYQQWPPQQQVQQRPQQQVQQQVQQQQMLAAQQRQGPTQYMQSYPASWR